jgi:Icc-related predicted phosphoesterase
VTAEHHRIAFYADIFYNSELSPPYWIPPSDLDVDAIVLGGDIHYSPDDLGAMLEEIRGSQKPTTQIVMVPGNGEYIDQELDQSRQEYRRSVERVPNAVFLDDAEVTLATGLRVIGSTLWSRVAEDQIDAYTKMLADHGLFGVDNIRVDGRFLTLSDTNQFHQRARSFIEGQLRPLSQADRRRTVVCTHFWPTLRPWLGPVRTLTSETSPSKTSRSETSPSETSPAEDSDHNWYQMVGTDMDSLIAECGPRLWLCGHAHETKHVTIGETEVLSNPRAGDGPFHVNPEFVESYVLEL